jgi:hypothetical protein
MLRRMTRLGTSGLAAAAAVLSLCLASPAHAAVGILDDAEGDAPQGELDIVGARVSNEDHRIVVRVRFDEVRRGELIVSVDPRGARGVRLVSLYRPKLGTKSFVVQGAFTNAPGGSGDVLPCDGFRVRWNDDRDVARLVLPSTCLQDGDYGAVRFAVLTEAAGGGGDSDLAPEDGSTPWIARG